MEQGSEFRDLIVGLLFGVALFDKMALGLPLGMLFGMAIGALIDARKQDKPQ